MTLSAYARCVHWSIALSGIILSVVQPNVVAPLTASGNTLAYYTNTKLQRNAILHHCVFRMNTYNYFKIGPCLILNDKSGILTTLYKLDILIKLYLKVVNLLQHHCILVGKNMCYFLKFTASLVKICKFLSEKIFNYDKI